MLFMTAWFRFALVVSLLASEPIDLGEVTEAHALTWDRQAEVRAWKLVLFPQSAPTNHQVIVISTNIVTVEDLKNLPDGVVLLEMQSIFESGIEGPVAEYKFILKKQLPKAPVIRKVIVPKRRTSLQPPAPDVMPMRPTRIRDTNIFPNPPPLYPTSDRGMSYGQKIMRDQHREAMERWLLAGGNKQSTRGFTPPPKPRMQE